jgi:hypothetical protein
MALVLSAGPGRGKPGRHRYWYAPPSIAHYHLNMPCKTGADAGGDDHKTNDK